MIDAHVHVWDLERGDYDWLADEAPMLQQDFTLADWAHAAAATEVSHVVLVQATPTLAETQHVLSIARRHPEQVLGVVGWVDLVDPGCGGHLEALAEDPLAVGVRPWLQAIDDPEWVLRADVGESLAAIENHGLVYEALALPVHLPHLTRLVEARPGLRVVLDHGAKPDIAGGQLEPWSHDLRRLAAAGDVTCKLSGLVSEAGGRTSAAELAPYVDAALAAFGPERLIWGSDWPVVSAVMSYADWHERARELVPREYHEQIFGTTAEVAYGLDVQSRRGRS